MLPLGCRRALSFDVIAGRPPTGDLGAFMICDVPLLGVLGVASASRVGVSALDVRRSELPAGARDD